MAPAWIEADSFRETMLQHFDDPEVRETVRAFGRVLFDQAVEASRDRGGESTTRAELRAVAADLRYAAGYCEAIGRSKELCSLEDADERLARFAKQVGRRLGILVQSIDRALS